MNSNEVTDFTMCEEFLNPRIREIGKTVFGSVSLSLNHQTPRIPHPRKTFNYQEADDTLSVVYHAWLA